MNLTHRKISIPRTSAIEALCEIEYILISLKNIARHYYDNVEHAVDIDSVAYALETTGFIDRNHVTQKLAKVRYLISEGFDSEESIDDMGDLEEKIMRVLVWSAPGD